MAIQHSIFTYLILLIWMAAVCRLHFFLFWVIEPFRITNRHKNHAEVGRSMSNELWSKSQYFRIRLIPASDFRLLDMKLTIWILSFNQWKEGDKPTGEWIHQFAQPNGSSSGFGDLSVDHCFRGNPKWKENGQVSEVREWWTVNGERWI